MRVARVVLVPFTEETTCIESEVALGCTNEPARYIRSCPNATPRVTVTVTAMVRQVKFRVRARTLVEVDFVFDRIRCRGSDYK